MNRRTVRIGTLTSISVIVVFGALCALAATNTIGFESSEGYHTGSIHGQNGWTVSAPGFYDEGITTTASHSGTQSFRWSNLAFNNEVQSIEGPALSTSAGETGSKANGGTTDVTPNNNHYVQDFWFRSVKTSTDTGLSVNISADDHSGMRMTFFRIAEAGGTLNTYFLPFIANTQDFPTMNVALNLNWGTWYHVRVEIFFVDGPSNDIVKVYLSTNQFLIASDLKLTTTDWEDVYSPTLVAVNTVLSRIGTDPQGHPVQGIYLDDLKYYTDGGPQNVCLRDNGTGNVFQFDPLTGNYKFTRCKDNLTLTGTGTVGLVNSIVTIADNKPDRRLQAGFNLGQLTGSATIYFTTGPGMWQTFRINDTSGSGKNCSCAF
jgi:hypothetical protein